MSGGKIVTSIREPATKVHPGLTIKGWYWGEANGRSQILVHRGPNDLALAGIASMLLDRWRPLEQHKVWVIATVIGIDAGGIHWTVEVFRGPLAATVAEFHLKGETP
jgi:hypothetical protein